MQLVKLNPYQVKVKIQSFATEHLVGDRHCIKQWDKAATAARERNLGSPIASLKACPEKSYWGKRKAAVHGTKEWQKLEAKSCGYDQGIKIQKDLWQVRVMQKGNKDQLRDEAPWNPVGFFQRNPLSHA